MKKANLIFPHQLFEHSPLIKNKLPSYLIEEHLFFKHYCFHKQKIAYHRASMKFYADFLCQLECEVKYVEATESICDIRKLIELIRNKGITELHYIDTCDFWLEKRILNTANKYNINLVKYDNPGFILKNSELKDFFKPTKKKFFQTTFYKQQRISLNVLIDENKQPDGGKWSFDQENRKKYPKDKKAPVIKFPDQSQFYTEAIDYVEKYFSSNLGDLSQTPFYPFDFKQSKKWLSEFLLNRFEDFGTYEDAIVKQETILNHSVLSPMLNVGLLTPNQVIESIQEFTQKNKVPINSQEGLIRQIIGWREFIRGIYIAKGVEERTKNYWNFDKVMPECFYTAKTGIEPVDDAIRKTLKSGYCHHIERLMILGNFMLLCEIKPNEVYRWFMEIFIDSYDWVMVPNVYGMSQFADGGLMSTKPYISGSNYVIKMSDYKKGEWSDIWDALFWRFMNKQRNFFLKNPRLRMLINTFDKMPISKQSHLLNKAEKYLAQLQ
ncbi:MAG: cryptochrome/photolyase family protein [Marinicellaceae bacterium]